MPFTGDIFTKAFSFVTKFKPRGAIRRSDMDQMYDDLADGLNNTRGFTKDAGLGVTEPPLLANIDDTTKPTGFYATSTATTGAFPSGAAAGSVIYNAPKRQLSYANLVRQRCQSPLGEAPQHQRWWLAAMARAATQASL